MKHIISLILFCALITPALARDKNFATIVSATRSTNLSCSGGNLASFTKVEAKPGKKDVTKDFSWSKAPPGSYTIHYEFTSFQKIGAECYEVGGPRNIKSFDLEIKAGEIYQLSLRDNLSVMIEVLKEVPLTDMLVGGIVQMVSSMQLHRDICSSLFVKNTEAYSRAFALSTVPKYESLFGMRPTHSPLTDTAQLRKKKLTTIGQTEAQAKEWCDKTYFTTLKDFDYEYGDRVNDVKAYSEKAAQKK